MPTVPWPAHPFTTTPWQCVHIVRWEDTTQKDDHGNYPVIDDPPVIRNFYDISQFGRRGSSHLIMGPEFQERAETILHMSVPNPTLYQSGDQIILFAELDKDADGNYSYSPFTDDGQPNGVAYFVDGDPPEDRMSPWPRLTMQFGGVVKIRRVT
jgi:hypothetical protein